MFASCLHDYTSLYIKACMVTELLILCVTLDRICRCHGPEFVICCLGIRAAFDPLLCGLGSKYFKMCRAATAKCRGQSGMNHLMTLKPLHPIHLTINLIPAFSSLHYKC